MGVLITNRKFTDEFTGAGGGGVTFPNGGIPSKMTVEIDFESFLEYINLTLDFVLGGDTITNNLASDDTSFLDDGNILGKGMKPGMTFDVVGTAFNDGSYTVLSVTEKVITITGVFLGTESVVCSLFDDTPIVALDFLYNLIENTEEETYLSLTDKGALQRFSVSGIDATDLVTVTNMLVASFSFGWVTNTLTVPATGETSEVTIIGLGITARRQKFKITQIFHIAPLALREQLINFQDKTPPEYFIDSKALKHIVRIETKFSATQADPPHVGGTTESNGLTNWFDQNNIRTKPEYFVDSITYTEDVTLVSLPRLDIDKIVNVVIKVKSRNAKFHATLTKIVMDFIYLPLDEADSINTPSTTLRQNFMNDRRFLPIATINNGELFGTDYQVLRDVNPVFVDTSNMTVNVKIDFSTFLKTFLKAKSSDNRNYAFIVTTQDQTIAITDQTDRVPVLCDFQNMDFDQEDDALLLSSDNIRFYHFPEINNAPTSDAGGWEGDPIYAKFPFRVEVAPVAGVTPTIMRAGFQIVVTKSGETDFVLEEKIFDTALVRKLDNVQTIDVSEQREFRDMETDYNTISFKRDNLFDSGTKKGFIFSYAFTLRYEFWLKLINDSERSQFALFEDIDLPTKSWHTLISDGWKLEARFFCDVRGYDDFVTTFDQYWTIRALDVGTAPDVAPIFTSTTKFFTDDGLTEVNGILIGQKTKIVFECLGDFSTLPPGFAAGFYGYFFADLETQGGIRTRRFASTEFNSEADSPFTPAAADGAADVTKASNNVRINIFNFTKIKVEAFYDDTVEKWSTRATKILIYPKLGLLADDVRIFEDGARHFWDDGVQADFET